MPPKRRRQDSESEGDSTSSFVMPKKVNAGGTELRRPTRTKPNGKLRPYSDIHNAERQSSSEEPSSSEDLSSSEQSLISVDESDTSTNDGASDQADLAHASSSTGSEDQPDLTYDQEGTAQAVERNGDKVWEILDGDERKPMAVGVEAPQRLRLRFRNRDTDEIREFNYKNGDANVVRDIDWYNRDHVMDIGKWRNQIFNRLKFPVRRLTRWGNEEVSCLTLLYEKMALAAAQTKRISFPTRDAIVQLFMEEYGDTHGRDQVGMRIRRKNGGRLAILKERLEGDLKPDGGPEYQLTLAPGELEAYMDDGHVRLAFDLAEYERIKDAKPVIEKAAKSRKTVARKQKKSSGKPAVKTTKTGRVAKTRKTRQTVKLVESDDSEKEEESGTDDEEPVESDKEPAESNQNTLGGKGLLHQFRKSRSLDVDDPKPGGHDAAPDWVHRHLVTGLEDSDIRNDPSRMFYGTQDREKAQKKLLEARNKWLATVMGPSAATETPIDPPQQPGAETDERIAPPETEDWLGQAYAGLHDRIERLEGVVHLAHEYRKYDDRNGERQLWYLDYDEETGERVKEAPAVNALLNSAIVPPIGYHGHVRALVMARALPEDELRLHELGQSVREAYHAAHDKEHADNAEMSKD